MIKYEYAVKYTAQKSYIQGFYQALNGILCQIKLMHGYIHTLMFCTLRMNTTCDTQTHRCGLVVIIHMSALSCIITNSIAIHYMKTMK